MELLQDVPTEEVSLSAVKKRTKMMASACNRHASGELERNNTRGMSECENSHSFFQIFSIRPSPPNVVRLFQD